MTPPAGRPPEPGRPDGPGRAGALARLLGPSVWLTGRLSFTGKFLLIGLVVVLALASLGVPLWQKVRQDRDLAEHQRRGLARFVDSAQVLAQVVALRDGTLEAQAAAASAPAAPAASAASAPLLAAALKRLAQTSPVPPAAAPLSQRWATYQGLDAAAGPQPRFAALNGVVNALTGLLQAEAQAHRLTADAELDRCFSMLTGRVPALIDTLGKQRAAARQREGELAAYALGVQVFLTESAPALRDGVAPLAALRPADAPRLKVVADALLAGISQQQDAADKTLDNPEAWGELSALAVRNQQLARQFLGSVAEVADARLQARIAQLLRTEWIIGGLMAAALLAMAYLFAGMYLSTHRSLARLQRGTEAFIAGRLDVRIRTDTQDELVQVAANFNTLAEAFARLLDQLREQNESRERELATLVQARTAELAERNEQLRQAGERARDELLLARDMQQAILTQDFPSHAGWAVHARMQPALELGGDFYDVYELPDGRCGLLVADVSGKGAAAALFMAVSRTLLMDLCASAAAPARVLEQANDQLCRHNPMEMFVTVCLGVFDPRDGTLDYACAGHPPPLRRRADGTVEALPCDHDLALGVLPGIGFAERRTVLGAQELLLLYSDGITEAFDGQGQAFGDARLTQWLAGCRADDAPAAQVEALVAAVEAHAGGASASDDLTCLILCRRTADDAAMHMVHEAHGMARSDATIEAAAPTADAVPDPSPPGDPPMPARLPAIAPTDKVLLLEHNLPARLAAIAVLADAVNAALPDRPDLAFSANLCLEELITNIIQHGLAGESDRVIRVRMSMSPQWLEIIIKDDAPPFDPFHQVGEPDLDAALDDRPIGGLGVHLVKTLMDDVRAYYDGSGNLIVLLKTLKREG